MKEKHSQISKENSEIWINRRAACTVHGYSCSSKCMVCVRTHAVCMYIHVLDMLCMDYNNCSLESSCKFT